MPSNTRLTQLIDYTSVLPYASELFGIYQPLLGWKSKRTEQRFAKGLEADRLALLDRLRRHFAADVDIRYDRDCQVDVSMNPGTRRSGKIRSFDSVLMESIAKRLPPYQQYEPSIWAKLINKKSIATAMKETVVPAYSRLHTERCQELASPPRIMKPAEAAILPERRRKNFVRAFEEQLTYESSTGGMLLFLTEHEQFDELVRMFYKVKDNSARTAELARMLSALQAQDAYLYLDNLDPQDKNDINSVALSPISIVHLFRQYFFELDTFLGTPVSHVWLSPGATVELIEVHTMKTIEERTIEAETTTTTKTESSTTDKDELSEAVKEENNQDVKFGAGVTASYMGITATSKFDYGTSQKTARESAHKQLREQTEKLSTEIRNNYKSTFKTVTETTDLSSKRYVLANTTDQLINYELRRKMRQVAVQVQDIGSYLCWQTYVDRPGEDLGVAELMHIATPAKLESLHAPDEIPMLLPFTDETIVTVPFVSVRDTDADNEDEVYVNGVEVDDSEALGNLELIRTTFPVHCVCKKANYRLRDVVLDGQGKPVNASLVKNSIANDDGKASYQLHLDSVDFQGQNSVQVKATLFWVPTGKANEEIAKKNEANSEKFQAKEAVEYQKAFMETARERITLSHSVRARPSDDLREEERIVIYRKLVQDMLTNGVKMPDDRTRHVVAELIESIFDVDKMLYFVAPEWWRPKQRRYSQQLGEVEGPPPDEGSAASRGVTKKERDQVVKITDEALSSETMGWGGVNSSSRDNYLITEDSPPAKFGSSLGWLLQLDGDNMRNAFLNAPWVKAVIPIRPTKEVAAINWLKGVEGFNGIGKDDVYRTNNLDEKDSNGLPLNGQKVIDVILDLAKKVQQKYEEGLVTGKYPTQDELGNPPLVDEANVVTATPIDRVYEHGFFPLEGGFRANVTDNYEVFDQWIEILPTDQIVPVEVKYDPRTGRQIP